MANILQGGARDTLNSDASGAMPRFAVTNYTEDFDFNANVNDTLVTSDVLATLIKQLIRKGIIDGTVA